MNPWPWVLRILWASLPFSAGPVYASALEELDRAAELTGRIGLWSLWAAGLTVSMVPHTVTLTPMRILAPGALAATVVATMATEADAAAIVALAVTAVTAAVSLAPAVGSWFVNGSSYGDERRVPLRPPGLLLVGPIPLAWAVVVATAIAAPLLLASGKWLVGILVAAGGGAMSYFSVAALHRLSRRWLVFVPAGVVVHDLMAMADPVLFKRNAIAGMGPALAGTDAVDLTMSALGLAIEIRLASAVEVALRPGPNRGPEPVELGALAISVSRPGAVLDEAERRRIRVG